MIKRLRVKFMCITMTIVTVMLCVIFATVFYFTSDSLEHMSINMMRTVAMSPFQLENPDQLPDDIQLPYFILQIEQDGSLLATGGGNYDLSDKAFLQELIDEVYSSDQKTGVISKYKLRFCRMDVPDKKCVVFADITGEINTKRNLLKNCLLIESLCFFAFLIISFLLTQWVVKPIDKAWKQQQQFVSDASHELKTPLTVILTNAELLQAESTDACARVQFTDNILVMARQMRELVESLLKLARVDNGILKQNIKTIDMSKLTADAILPFEPIYFEKGMKIVCNIEDGIIVKGSNAHLRQVIEIFLDNAQKYALPNSTVTVCLKKTFGMHCLLSVENVGEPIPREHLQNIFKRFYRVDDARSRNGSYGLGLAIAEQIIREHGGKIWAESSRELNTFYAELPMSSKKDKT